MNIRARRLVYLFFIIIFAIATPLLILYTSGYRYNSQQQRLESTGTMVLSSIPKGAAISLDGQTLKYVTPKTIQAIKPGTYTIQLSKNGFKPWQKRLTVRAGEAIFVSNVRLWRESAPLMVSRGIYQIFSPNPDETALILTSWNGNKEQFFLFNILTDESPALVYERPMRQPSEQIMWSAQGNRALVIGDDETAVIDLGQTTVWRSLNSFMPDGLINFRWDPDYDYLIYGSDGSSIYRLDIEQQTIVPLLPDSVNNNISKQTDFWLNNNILYELLERQDEASVLRITSLSDAAQREIPLPQNAKYKLLDWHDDLTALIDSNQTMSLWRLNGDSFLTVLEAKHVTHGLFSKKTGDLVYATLFELWTYNPKTGVKNMLTRIAAEIKQAVWFPDGSHILFNADDTLFIIERDERDVRNQWTLTSLQEASGYVISPDGAALFFAGTAGKNSGLWRLDL